MGLVEPVAANFRGLKGIPFEDLVAAGREGLVKAARLWWPGSGKFTTFAIEGISQHVQNLVRDWQNLDVAGASNLEDLDKDFFEWQSFFVTPYEYWKALSASPEELFADFETVRESREALSSAMLGLSRRERDMVCAAYLADPRQSLRSIARDHKVSYGKTVRILKRALSKLRSVVVAIENKRGTGSCLA